MTNEHSATPGDKGVSPTRTTPPSPSPRAERPSELPMGIFRRGGVR
ncbi:MULTISPECIES: hypothetical protein [Streptomycetaceae]|nr:MULTISPECIES: hypothetical protein [Streptomycetaceae]MYS57654.1 hypothetical protein [Streptomyces sp. SID5468]